MVYTFPTYVPILVAVVAVLAAAVGAVILWLRKPWSYALVAFAVSALVGGILAPGLMLDRVVLDDEKLEQTTGFWFAPTVKGFRLADVVAVTIGTKQNSRGREYEVWLVHRTNGQTQEFDPGDLWEMNGADIIERLRAKGIQVRQEAMGNP